MELIHAPRMNAQNLPWFNVKYPLDLPDLQGKLAILDFWTFCCINCIHIIPTLKRIEEKFPESAGVLKLENCLYVSDTNNHRILKIDLDSNKTEIFIQ